MKHLLIVTERCSIVYGKLVANLAAACAKRRIKVSVLVGEDPYHLRHVDIPKIEDKDFRFFAPSWDEHGYLAVHRVARHCGADHIFYADMPYPQRLFLAIDTEPGLREIPCSFKITGASFYMRRPINQRYVEKLLDLDCVRSVFCVSNGPAELSRFCRENTFMHSDKLRHIHDPIYDHNFNAVDRLFARQRLGIPPRRTVLLFFGSFFYSKGPDIAAIAARLLADDDRFFFVFAGSTESLPAFIDRSLFEGPNLKLADGFVNEDDEILYYSACDYVLMPYRRFYTYGSSAVLVQAALMGRPLLMADIFPFNEVVRRHRLGDVFTAESPEDLAAAVRDCPAHPAAENFDFSGYLREIETWDDILPLMEGRPLAAPGTQRTTTP